MAAHVEEPSIQLTFGDAEGLGKRKTRREIFLAEMEQVVPWKALLAHIEPRYPRSGRVGRPPYAMDTMRRIHLLQQWYALSDPAMEEALHAIIHAPSSTKNAGKERDPEMHQTRKGNQWYFGMKAHIGVDEFSGLVHHVKCTAANVGEVTVTHELLRGKEECVFGDSGYTGAYKRAELADCKAAFFIAAERSRVKAISNTRERKQVERWETCKASLGAKVEHPFRTIKRQFGYTKVRYRGLAKNTAQVLTLFALSNLWMVRRQLMPA